MEIFPIDSKGKKRVWRQTRPSLMKLVSAGSILIAETKSGWKVRIKDRIKMTVKPKKQKEIQNSRLFYGFKLLNVYKDKYWNKKSWK